MNTITLYFVGVKEPGSEPQLVDGPFVDYNKASAMCDGSSFLTNTVVVEVEIPTTLINIIHV